MASYIKCGQLFCAKDDAVLKDMAVVIEGNRIIEVAPMAECPPREGQEVVDLSGKFVMPGLIDAHLHTGMSGEADTTQCMYYQRDGELALISMLNAQQDLLAGLTTVRDEGRFHFIDIDLKNMID